MVSSIAERGESRKLTGVFTADVVTLRWTVSIVLIATLSSWKARASLIPSHPFWCSHFAAAGLGRFG